VRIQNRWIVLKEPRRGDFCIQDKQKISWKQVPLQLKATVLTDNQEVMQTVKLLLKKIAMLSDGPIWVIMCHATYNRSYNRFRIILIENVPYT